MSPTLECPTRQQLTDFVLGKLSEDQSDSVVQHLKVCPDCQMRIDTQVDGSDTFLKKLKQPMPNDAFLREPQCQRAVAGSESLARELVSMGCHLAVAQGEAMARNLEAEDSSSAADLTKEVLPGEDLGFLRDYKLLRKLGQGGMGTVYEALHTHLNRHAAVKVLPAEKMRNSQAVDRFHREMQAIGKLDHPNIVRAQDAGEADGKHFLVMEYVEGLDLSTLAQRVGQLPVADACELIRQAAVGLHYAHEVPLVHRDIKPSNIMVTPDGTVKLLDLGLALLSEPPPDCAELTTEGQVMGTLDYMAPEQLGDAHAVDRRADIYSLGATFYKLLSGRAPYANKQYSTPTKKLMAIATKPVKPIGECRDDVPSEVVELLDRMLAKDPDDRCASAEEVAAAVQPIAATSELSSLVERATDKEQISVRPPKSSTLDQVSSPLIDTRPTHAPAEPKPATQPIAQRTRFTGSWQIAILLLAATVAGAALAAVVLRVKTPDGTLVLTLDQATQAADVIVEVDGERAVNVRTAQDSRTLKISVDPGKHTLRVKHEDGTVLLTDEFTLERNGVYAVRARLEDEMPQQDTPPSTVDYGESDRKAAEWVLEHDGGFVTLWVPGNPNLQLTRPGDLPDTQYRLLYVEWPTAASDTCGILRGLTELRAVSVSSSDPGIGDEVLANLIDSTKLESLVLENAGVTARGLRHLKQHSNLTCVSLNLNPISDENLGMVSHLSHLTELHLTGTLVSDRGIIDHIASFRKLERLWLSSLPVTDQGLKGLVELQHLKHLELVATRISDEGLRFMADSLSIETLHLDSTAITDEGLKHLARMQTLQDVSVVNVSQITDDGMEYLTQLKSLRCLNATQTSVTDRGVRNICTAKSLEELSLANNKISDEAIPFLLQLPKLRVLVLSGTSITDSSVKRLTAIRTLRNLALDSTSVTDAAIEHLASLTALEVLSIRRTRISTKGHERLKQLVANCQVYWEPLAESDPAGQAAEPPALGTDRDRQREVARWILDNGGTVNVRLMGDREVVNITDVEKLPEDAFVVTYVGSQGNAALNNEAANILADLPELRSVSLDNVPIGDDALQYLSAARELRDLRLSWTQVTGTGFHHLRDLKKLVLLDLRGCPIKDEYLRSLLDIPSLRDLGLAETDVSDTGLSVLGAKTNLKRLDIDDNPVTDKGLLQLKSLARLDSLLISGTLVSDAGLACLADTLHLSSINCDNMSQVTNEGLQHLKRMDTLTSVTLRGNRQLSDKGIHYLADAAHMTSLSLFGTSVSDACIPDLLQLRNLVDLDIQGTDITEDGFERLKAGLPKSQVFWNPRTARYSIPMTPTATANSPNG